MVTIVADAQWYEVIGQGDGVSLIHEPHIKPFYRCNIWHVRGRDRDLLIDSGMGVVSLRQTVALVSERPLTAVASHSHFDHIGNHHEFPDRAIHAGEADILADPANERTLADRYAHDEIFDAFPVGWAASDYRVKAAPATRILGDGDIIDLGDRVFEVMHMPGHSPGGIALWEAATGILFSGDTVYDGELIDDTYHSDLSDYAASMERLRSLPVRVVHGGHFQSFGAARHVELIDEYLAGRRKPGCPND